MNGGFLQGLNAITNNVDQMAQGFGRMSGMSTAAATAFGSWATVGIVGLQLAIPLIKAGVEAMGLWKPAIDPAISELDRLKGKIEEINARPVKIGIDRIELAGAEADLKRITKEQDKLNELRGLKSKATRDSEAAILAAIGEAPGEGKGVVRDVKNSIAQKMVNESPAIGKATSDIATKTNKIDELEWRGAAATEGGRGLIRRLHEEVRELTTQRGLAFHDINKEGGVAERQAAKIIAGDLGADVRDASLRKAKRGGLADDLKRLTPKAMQQTAEDDAHAEAMDEEARASGKRASQFVKEQKQKTKDEEHENSQIADAANAEAVASGHGATKLRRDREDEAHKTKIAAKKIKSEAETNAKMLGHGGLMQQAELDIANEARRRTEANSLPAGERATAIRNARRAGDPILSKEEAEARAEQRAMNRLSSQAVVDAAGNPLDATQRRAAAHAIVGDAKGDLAKRQIGLQGQVGNEVMRTQQIVNQLASEVERLAGQAAAIRQNNDQLAAAGQRRRNPGLNRGR